MRLTHAFIVLALATVSATALAQQGAVPAQKLPPGAQISPQVTIPATKDGAKFTLPPNVVAKAPALTAPQLDLAKTRKVATAGQWGLTINQSNLKESFWLTPLQPNVPNGAHLFVANDGPAGMNYATSAELPFGSLSLGRTPSGAWWVGLRDVPSTNKDWLLVECHVAGASSYGLSVEFRPSAGASSGGARLQRTGLAAKDGRISALIEPTTLAKRSINVMGYGPAPGTWNWGGCEVTPIQL